MDGVRQRTSGCFERRSVEFFLARFVPEYLNSGEAHHDMEVSVSRRVIYDFDPGNLDSENSLVVKALRPPLRSYQGYRRIEKSCWQLKNIKRSSRTVKPPLGGHPILRWTA